VPGDGPVAVERHGCAAHMGENEETAGEDEDGQRLTQLSCGAYGEDQQRQDGIRQGVRAELNARNI